jgi:hypothetical protein
VGNSPARAVEEAPGPQKSPSEGAQGQPKRGGGLVELSEVVALVSATALVGGGAGMLVGVALGAINPFALGIVGVVAGIGLLVLLTVGARRSWWGRVFGG